MAKSLLAYILIFLLTAPLSACLVRTTDNHRHRTVRQPRCHPSQYWDGNSCRHKGRGHGARKHDGRR
jgi:hypothetical protein